MTSKERDSEAAVSILPNLRFAVPEAARILRVSKAFLYNRLHQGALRAQKDGARTYVTLAELERYVESCNGPQEVDRTQQEFDRIQEAPRRSKRHTGGRANGTRHR